MEVVQPEQQAGLLFLSQSIYLFFFVCLCIACYRIPKRRSHSDYWTATSVGLSRQWTRWTRTQTINTDSLSLKDTDSFSPSKTQTLSLSLSKTQTRPSTSNGEHTATRTAGCCSLVFLVRVCRLPAPRPERFVPAGARGECIRSRVGLTVETGGYRVG